MKVQYFSLNLGEGECDQSDESNTDILLHFGAAVVAE